MIIELDLFSGRPNPRWSLTKEQEQEFTHLLSTLPEQSMPLADHGILGYRGMIIYEDEDSPTIMVGLGEVIRQRLARSITYMDEGRKIEKWLLSTAQGQIDSKTLSMIEDGL